MICQFQQIHIQHMQTKLVWHCDAHMVYFKVL